MNVREFEKRLRHLRKVEQIVQPDLKWVKTNREALMLRLQEDRQRQASFSLTRYLRSFVQQFIPSHTLAYVRGPVAAALSGISVLLGGSIASVSAAERSLPGDLLYPVKLVTEQTRLVLVSNKTEKLKLKTEFVGRRVDEIQKIVTQDVPEKPQRLKEAAAILKRDLDTVKNQLNDVSEAEPVDRAKVAKQVDQTGTDIATSLKKVKTDAPQEVRAELTEAEVAAVNTSIKAVQVILDSQSDREAQKVVSREEVAQSISAKVDGVQAHLTDATQQLVNVGGISATSSLALAHATSSLPLSGASATTSLLNPSSAATTSASVQALIDAHTSLAEAKQLLSEDKLEQVGSKLAEAGKAVVSVEKRVEALSEASSSTASVVDPKIDAGASSTASAKIPSSQPSSSTTAPLLTASTTPPVSPPSATHPR